MTRSLLRITAVALATVALTAPTALARIDLTPPAAKPAAPAQHGQGARPAGTARLSHKVLDRPSTPLSSRPNRASARPVTVSVASADHGIDWTTIGIGVAASLLAFGALAAIAGRTRRTVRPRVSA